MKAIASTVEEWETPEALFARLDEEFGFTLDVAASDRNAKTDHYLTRFDDALSQPWRGVCWCNPPYGPRVHHWLGKALAESRRGCTVVCLVPARTDAAWFHEIALKHGEVRFIRGRVHFRDPDGRTGRPRFASCLVIFRPA